MADYARGQLLVQLRQARHLNQEDAAHELGVSTKSLRAWEHGGRIRWPNAQRVAAFYGIDPERLVSRTANGDPAEPALPETDLRAQLDRIEQRIELVIAYFDITPDSAGRPELTYGDAYEAILGAPATPDETEAPTRTRPAAG